MELTNNSVLITGGATGIGLELARQLLERGNEVIICGRRRERLEEAKTMHPGLHARVANVADPGDREDLLGFIERHFPRMNVLVNNAGVQHLVDFKKPEHLQRAKEEIEINLLAPMQLTNLFLPHLQRQPSAAIVNVTSGLGFAPLARMPVYCATKAALHSITMSLRHQLRDTNVKVFETIPPIVTSELGSAHRPAEANRTAMPTGAAVTEMLEALERDEYEYAIGEAKRLRAAREELFGVMNRG
ncbi:MAG TPA: SDR family NAD(P)-dependent oxidoreductase [Thermoanaerobaculia bacterium]|jgi:uncharacterized oxidoreductase|nr:SDR family NAD(P)-dependent oxidoreductase [Thermoanaerobaculia bacterium]